MTKREVYRDFQPSLTSSAGPVYQGLIRPQVPCALPKYTASQLLTLHKHRANNQSYRMANQIKNDFYHNCVFGVLTT